MRGRSTAEEDHAALPTCKGAPSSERALQCPYEGHLAPSSYQEKSSEGAQSSEPSRPSPLCSSAPFAKLWLEDQQQGAIAFLSSWCLLKLFTLQEEAKGGELLQNPALMQRHCSTAGWKEPQPWQGLALPGAPAHHGGNGKNPRGSGAGGILKLRGVGTLGGGIKIAAKVRSVQLTQTQHEIPVKDLESLKEERLSIP